MVWMTGAYCSDRVNKSWFLQSVVIITDACDDASSVIMGILDVYSVVLNTRPCYALAELVIT